MKKDWQYIFPSSFIQPHNELFFSHTLSGCAYRLQHAGYLTFSCVKEQQQQISAKEKITTPSVLEVALKPLNTQRVRGGGAEEFWLCGHGPETEGRGNCFCLVLAKERDPVQGDKWQSLLRSSGSCLGYEGKYPLALAIAHRAGKHLTKKTQDQKKGEGAGDCD